jgi:hypothetical protein
MDNGTGFGLNYSSSRATKAHFTIWKERVSSMFLGRSLSSIWGLLCDNLLGVENKHTGLDERYIDLHPTNKKKEKSMPMKLSTRNREEDPVMENMSIPSKLRRFGSSTWTITTMPRP